jgi:hypothetical protein
MQPIKQPNWNVKNENYTVIDSTMIWIKHGINMFFIVVLSRGILWNVFKNLSLSHYCLYSLFNKIRDKDKIVSA